MPLIAFLAPDEDMLATARATLAKTHPDVLLEQGLLSAGVRKARTLACPSGEGSWLRASHSPAVSR